MSRPEEISVSGDKQDNFCLTLDIDPLQTGKSKSIGTGITFRKVASKNSTGSSNAVD